MQKSGNYIAVAVIVLLALTAVGVYNGLQTARIEVGTAYANVENQIQRRADLIPNLVATVKGYIAYEEKVLTDVTEARSRIAQANSPADMAAADAALTGALGRLIAVAENYPDLKADSHFTELMREIAGSENRIAVARRDYNEAVNEYNIAVATLPGSLFAGFLGFQTLAPFAADEAAHSVPQVSF